MKGVCVVGQRRFTCLAPGLVRMEFDPAGQFENRSSVVAAGSRRPVAFQRVTRRKGEVVLDTGRMTVISRENDRAFFPRNLEIRWMQDDATECWNPGDVDHRNLGGTVPSLDDFSRDMPLKGVHVADELSPDRKANVRLGLLHGIEDVPYYREGRGPERLKAQIASGNVHLSADLQPEIFLTRTVNHMLDQRKFGPGLLSRSGYFLLNDSDSAVLDADGFPVERNRPGARDWYFFCYGRDYAEGLADFIRLSGPAPLPPRHLFGLIFSRWPAYDETEAKAIVARFRDESIPLGALVLDMEWHQPGWCNWDWNRAFYPDPAGFFRWCHENNLLVTLNVHPERIHANDSHYRPFLRKTGKRPGSGGPVNVDGKSIPTVETNLCDKSEARAFMALCHDPVVKQGLDFWWVDGCSGGMNGAGAQLVANKVFFENSESAERRGTCLSRYGGLGSHRYGLYFTGDTHSQWEVLEKECEFNIRAGHLGLAYVSHDIGGFSHPRAPLIDPPLFIRWLQFGVFNPVLRFHSSPGSGSRQGWDYGDANWTIGRRWLRLRNSLLPYIYSAARRHHDTGMPIVRGLFFEHPGDDAAYRFDEFMFGPSLLVAPVLRPESLRRVYLPRGRWVDYATGAVLEGPRELALIPRLADLPLYARAGSILTRQAGEEPGATGYVRDLLLEIFPGGDGEAELYEDDGRSPRYKRKGGFTRTRITLHDDGETMTLTCHPGEGATPDFERQLTVEAPLPVLPAEVRVNGRPWRGASAGAMDAHPGRYRVTLPPMDSRRRMVVAIRRAASKELA